MTIFQIVKVPSQSPIAHRLPFGARPLSAMLRDLDHLRVHKQRERTVQIVVKEFAGSVALALARMEEAGAPLQGSSVQILSAERLD